MPHGPQSMMKALIVAPAWIGDAVLAQPLLQRLHERHPGIVIDALAARWVAPVLARMPQIGQLIDNPFAHGEVRLSARWQLARRLASAGYTHAYVLPNSLKSALIPWFAGIPRRIGFTGESRLGLINVRHHLDPVCLPLMVERFAQLAEAPGSPLPRPLPTPQLTATLAGQTSALAAVAAAGAPVNTARAAHPADRPPPGLVIFCPGAEFGPAKQWPVRHYAALAQQLTARGKTVWLLGSPKDREVGAAIVAASQGACHNLAGQTSLDQAIDLISLAEQVVCNDSGLMHIAAALNRPLIALYGSTSPDFTPPLSPHAQVLRLGLGCSPCFKRTCPLGHLDCLEQLSPAQVLERMFV